MLKVTDIVDAFGGLVGFAHAIEVNYEAAKKMRDRNVIHASHWLKLTKAARRYRVRGITLKRLAEMAAE